MIACDTICDDTVTSNSMYKLVSTFLSTIRKDIYLTDKTLIVGGVNGDIFQFMYPLLLSGAISVSGRLKRYKLTNTNEITTFEYKYNTDYKGRIIFIGNIIGIGYFVRDIIAILYGLSQCNTNIQCILGPLDISYVLNPSVRKTYDKKMFQTIYNCVDYNNVLFDGKILYKNNNINDGNILLLSLYNMIYHILKYLITQKKIKYIHKYGNNIYSYNPITEYLFNKFGIYLDDVSANVENLNNIIIDELSTAVIGDKNHNILLDTLLTYVGEPIYKQAVGLNENRCKHIYKNIIYSKFDITSGACFMYESGTDTIHVDLPKFSVEQIYFNGHFIPHLKIQFRDILTYFNTLIYVTE